MSRKLRRQAQRDNRKREEALQKQAVKLPMYRRVLTSAWTAFVAFTVVVGLVAAYPMYRPHISIEPQIALNPVDPYTTQFNLKNENPMFGIYSINAVCWPRSMQSGNNFSVISPGPLPNVHHEIPGLEAGASSTVDCPPVIGGIGRWSGVVENAELELLVSYRQNWWPFEEHERYPFASRRDVQGAVHWVHTTLQEEKSLEELLRKGRPH
jgi:hypothetical protein